MSDLKYLNERIDTLESRLTFQDDIIETLNKTVTEQWQQIDALKRSFAALQERLEVAESRPATPMDERPPHY